MSDRVLAHCPHLMNAAPPAVIAMVIMRYHTYVRNKTDMYARPEVRIIGANTVKRKMDLITNCNVMLELSIGISSISPGGLAASCLM